MMGGPYGFGHMMPSWNYNYSFFGVLSMILMLIFWAALIVGVVLLVKWVIGTQTRVEEKPLDILKKRYAAGEISREEFLARKKELS
jgi:putative membrane protein